MITAMIVILSESIIIEAMVLKGQRPQVRFSAFPRIYFNTAEIYQWPWLEESGQRLENVDPTHVVLLVAC